jgi:hypothetical protein
MVAHCNDASAARMADLGWRPLVVLPYADLPAEVRRAEVPGAITYMYKDLRPQRQ